MIRIVDQQADAVAAQPVSGFDFVQGDRYGPVELPLIEATGQQPS